MENRKQMQRLEGYTIAGSSYFGPLMSAQRGKNCRCVWLLCEKRRDAVNVRTMWEKRPRERSCRWYVVPV